MKTLDKQLPVNLTSYDAHHLRSATMNIVSINVYMHSLQRQIQEVENGRDRLSQRILRHLECSGENIKMQRIRVLLSMLSEHSFALATEMDELILRNKEIVRQAADLSCRLMARFEKMKGKSSENVTRKGDKRLQARDYMMQKSMSRTLSGLINYERALKENQELIDDSLGMVVCIRRYASDRNTMLSQIIMDADLKPSAILKIRDCMGGFPAYSRDRGSRSGSYLTV